MKRKLFYKFGVELIAQGTQEQLDYKKMVDEKKEKTKTNVHAITKGGGKNATPTSSPATGTATAGLVKRDKERTKKIIEKYKSRPNMEATKKRVILGCHDKNHYWGSLQFCDVLLDLDTINERKRICMDKNVCLLCLCPGH